jgi:hypothetical protein
MAVRSWPVKFIQPCAGLLPLALSCAALAAGPTPPEAGAANQSEASSNLLAQFQGKVQAAGLIVVGEFPDIVNARRSKTPLKTPQPLKGEWPRKIEEWSLAPPSVRVPR